jgi:hypothetical protein
MSSYRSPAMRRYILRLAVATTAYLVTLAIAVRFVGVVEGPLAYLLALLPGVSVAGMFWAIGRLMIEEQDEYQRMLLVRQSLVATGFTLSVVTIWGFLENFNLVQHVDAFFIAVLWFFGLGIGAIANKVRP